MEETVLFSRTARGALSGKQSETIPKVMVSEQMKLDFLNRVNNSACESQSEYLRLLIMKDLYGIETIKSLQTAAIDSMTSIGDE